MNIRDRLGRKAVFELTKFKDPDGKIEKLLRAGKSIESVKQLFPSRFLSQSQWKANIRTVPIPRIALNEGLGELIDIACGIGSPVKWDNTNARLGVGNSNTAPAATQTGLLGGSKAYKGMDSSYPARVSQTAEWRATFGSSEANFAWEEYTVVNAADDSGKNLNRTTASKGTKVVGESWTLSLKITFS